MRRKRLFYCLILTVALLDGVLLLLMLAGIYEPFLPAMPLIAIATLAMAALIVE